MKGGRGGKFPIRGHGPFGVRRGSSGPSRGGSRGVSRGRGRGGRNTSSEFSRFGRGRGRGDSSNVSNKKIKFEV